MVAIGLVELSGPLGRRPLRDKARQGASNLRAIDAMVARVRRSITSGLKLETWHRIANDLRQLAHARELLEPFDVEGFRMNRITRRLEHGDEGAADVFDVNDRSLARTVALDRRPAPCDGVIGC
jgi:hypothetical protein